MPHIFQDFLSNTQTAGKWEKLLRVAGPKDSLAIVLYGEPDPDSLASGWALQHLLREHVKTIKIFATQPIKRKQNIRFFEALKIPLEIVKEVPWQNFTKFAVVDAQPNFFKPAPPVPFDIVIDHHPRREHYSFKFSDVRQKYGSTSTIMLEYLLRERLPISKNLATALWYGLRTDTNNLSTSVSTADLAAFGFLYKRGDGNLIHWLESSEIPLAYKEYFEKALKGLNNNKKKAVIYIGKITNPDACVMVADFLSRFIGLRWVAVAGVSNNVLYVIFRSGAFGVHVGRIARRKFKKMGSAGGHQNKARAEIPLSALEKEMEENKYGNDIEKWICKIL